MSVLIKGMKMPKSCGDCNFYYVDYEEGTASCLATSCYVQPHHHRKDNRDPDCPLVEIPTPHGRLIDADKLIEYLNEWLSDSVALFGFTRIINHQPTIIEAEVRE